MVSGKIRVVGIEHLPSTGGFILASTHTSWFDPLWLARAVAPRRIHFMAKEELFRNPVVAWYLRMIFCVSSKPLALEHSYGQACQFVAQVRGNSWDVSYRYKACFDRFIEAGARALFRFKPSAY